MAKALAAGELRNSTEEELNNKLAEAKTELFNLRFQAATGQLESHGRLRVDAGDLLADGTEPSMALQLAGRGLEAEVEQLRLRLGQLVVELFLGGVAQFAGGKGLSHHASPSPGGSGGLSPRASRARFTNFAPCSKQSMGSLCVNITPHQPLA